MVHRYDSQLLESAEAIQYAADIVKSILPPEMAALSVGIISALDTQRNIINALRGIANASTSVAEELQPLPPITHIFGQEIKMQHSPVTSEHLQPNDDERTKFLQELDAFYKEFPKLELEQINALIQMPSGEVKVRALAQKVGIGDYKAREINYSLVAEIKKGIINLNNYAKEQEMELKAIDNELGTTVVKPGAVELPTKKK